MFIYQSQFPVTNIQTIKADYQALVTDDILMIDATAGAVTVTLPSAAAVRSHGSITPITIIKTDASANAVTIAAGETINGTTSLTAQNQGGSFSINANSSAWQQVAQGGTTGGGGGSNSNQAGFAAYLGTNQVIATGVNATLALDTEIYDSDGWFDTATHRFTPQLAGTYLLWCNIRSASGLSTLASLTGYTYFNGVALESTGHVYTNYSAASYPVTGSWQIAVNFNGTTDYASFHVLNGNNANATIPGNQSVMGGATFLHS